MPTTRPRHLVTETGDLARALDAAAERWPGRSRPQLLVRLALEGHRADELARGERRRARLEALQKHSGALTGAFAPDHLEELRRDWPE